MTDNINNPEHYNKHKVECIEYARNMSFSLGSAFKYVWRCYDKDKPIEDLNKAIRCLKDYNLYEICIDEHEIDIINFIRLNLKFKTANIKLILIHLLEIHNKNLLETHNKNKNYSSNDDFLHGTIELINNEIENIKNDN